ncbi:MAG: pyridoxamine 5'-phosphate oxidase [Actinobacteria bacterium]|nr:pyridoxamine 5'-phosphate oxidase [Actinomycetota bacterium]
MSIRDRRIQYETAGLDVGDLDRDPFAQFNLWYSQAEEAGITEPHAMTLSTVDVNGAPDSRVVLARAADERGFVFYTNYDSAKSAQLEENPVASAVFAWLDLHRQVRVRGNIMKVSAVESDDYFASRPRASQIGAWASPQSRVLANRDELEALVAEMTARFEGHDVPRPENWGGWRLIPVSIEFWQGRPSRLHDRFRYERDRDSWTMSRLAP